VPSHPEVDVGLRLEPCGTLRGAALTDLAAHWKQKTDDDLIEAVRHWNDYTDESHLVMLAELQRRGLKVPEPATAKPDVSTDRKRGGCLSAILSLILLTNPVLGLYYLFEGDTIRQAQPTLPAWILPAMGLLALCNFAFAVAAWNWKKWGVYGLALSSILAFVINTDVFGFFAAVSGLLSVVVLAVLVRPVWSRFD
jgi:hypothetical protein